jgi:phage-related tail fiber protein
MGVLDTTYTFTATDVVTSTKLNNVIDQTTFTSSAFSNTTLAINSSGQLRVNTSGITQLELADNSVTTLKILDGAVTAAKTNNSLVPTGAFMPFAMITAPTGWLKANGAAISRTGIYANLFATIGTTFGVGDGSSTFNLPDLRGQFIRSWADDGTVYDSGRAFGTTQADDFKSHTHSMFVHPATGSGGNTNPARFDNLGLGSFNTQATGGTETRPRNIALLYCIKY